MDLSTAWAVQAIVQATLFMTISALVVRGLIGVSRCVSASTQRILWFLVLVQGLIIVPVPLNVPWYTPPSQPPATTDLSPAPVRDFADDPPHESFRPPFFPGSSNPLARSETSELPAAEARPLLAPHGIASKLTGIWQWALMFWGLGMSLRVGKGLWRYLRFLRRLQVVESPDATWAAQWQQLLASHGVDRRIPLLVTRDIGPALVRLPFGYQVIVPEAAWARLTASQRQSILRHELAHYQQGDLWRLLAIRLLALPHWFNPASWWAIRKFEECTEWLCDCAAVNDPTPGTSTTEYARALLQLGSMRFPQTSWVGAAQGSRLVHRIHRLLSNHFMEDSLMKKVVLISVAVGLLLVGNIRIRLVAKEPSAMATMAERKPAAETKPAVAAAPRKPVENLPDKTAKQPTRPLADLSAFPDEPAAHAIFDQMLNAFQKAKALSFHSRLTVVGKEGRPDGATYYRAWLKKPNYCRIEGDTEYDDPKMMECVNKDRRRCWSATARRSGSTGPKAVRHSPPNTMTFTKRPVSLRT
jgi:beta-lactamase regulating signal transducer with metallopeptidase domain